MNASSGSGEWPRVNVRRATEGVFAGLFIERPWFFERQSQPMANALPGPIPKGLRPPAPRVGRHELPWDREKQSFNPSGVAAPWPTEDANEFSADPGPLLLGNN